jgi:hypothetical protein
MEVHFGGDNKAATKAYNAALVNGRVPPKEPRGTTVQVAGQPKKRKKALSGREPKGTTAQVAKQPKKRRKVSSGGEKSDGMVPLEEPKTTAANVAGRPKKTSKRSQAK